LGTELQVELRNQPTDLARVFGANDQQFLCDVASQVPMRRGFRRYKRYPILKRAKLSVALAGGSVSAIFLAYYLLPFIIAAMFVGAGAFALINRKKRKKTIYI
jgi:hypothetical protein